MTPEELKIFLTANKDKAEYAAVLVEFAKPAEVTTELLAEYLNTDEGRKMVKTHPAADERVTEAIKNHDAKKKAEIEAEIKRQVAAELIKRNPEETPEQKANRELREEFEAEKKGRAREKLERQLLEEATKRKLDILPHLNSGWLPESFEQGVVVLQSLENTLKERETFGRNEALKGGYKPGSGKSDEGKVKIENLTLEQALALEQDGKLDAALGAS